MEGYGKDSLERFFNQYVRRGVQGPARDFCESGLGVDSKTRVVMEFMQQDLASVNEIFEMIKIIELDQWFLETNVDTSAPGLFVKLDLLSIKSRRTQSISILFH